MAVLCRLKLTVGDTAVELGSHLRHQYIHEVVKFDNGRGQMLALNHQRQGGSNCPHGIKAGGKVGGSPITKIHGSGTNSEVGLSPVSILLSDPLAECVLLLSTNRICEPHGSQGRGGFYQRMQ